MDTIKIIKEMHQGLQLKGVLDLVNVSIDELSTGLNINRAETVEILSSPTINDGTLKSIALFLQVPVELIKNFKYDLAFQPNILSENNTIINYNHCINQNSIENIAKIYEVVRDLVKKDRDSKQES